MSATAIAAVGEGQVALAAALCREAGLAEPTGLTRLVDGRNNRVSRVDLADGGRVVLKCYHHDPGDKRDRLAAEWNFLAYAREREFLAVPRPLARAVSAHAALYGFVEGRKLRAGEVEASHIAAALDLVRRINAPPRDLARLAVASEACFTLAEHIATVERRIARLNAIEAGATIADAARAFIATALLPSWHAVKERALAAAATAGIEVWAALPTSETCLSPSDFGYHNALLGPEGALTFIDFEYAGRDDPAKLVCDFFCQPDVPAPLDHFEGFAAGVTAALDLPASHVARMRLLLDAYRLKWICIMLNEFLPLGAARRAFADPRLIETRRREQLDKAVAAMAAIGVGTT